MRSSITLLAAAPLALSGCFLTDNDVAAIAAAASLNAGVATFAETNARPGGSFDQRIVTDGITGFASDAEGNEAIKIQADATFANLTVTFEDGSTLVLPAFAASNSSSGEFGDGVDLVSYTQRFSDYVSIASIGVAAGAGRIQGFTAIGTQTAPGDVPTVGNAVSYNGTAFVTGPNLGLGGGGFSYDLTIDFAGGTFTGTGISGNPAVGQLDAAGTIVGNRLVGNVTLTPVGAAVETGHLDGGFFRDNAQDIGAVFAIPSTDRIGYIFARE